MAGAVGLLLAAFYRPVFSLAVRGAEDLAIALVVFGLLRFGRWPPWLLVVSGAAVGWLLGLS